MSIYTFAYIFYIFIDPVKYVLMNSDSTSNSVSVNGDLKIDVLQLKKAALILRAVNHKLRQQILKIIYQNDRMTVT